MIDCVEQFCMLASLALVLLGQVVCRELGWLPLRNSPQPWLETGDWAVHIMGWGGERSIPFHGSPLGFWPLFLW